MNAVGGAAPDYATTFLILAPNVIVFERLRLDFAGGRIFKTDPIVPKDLQIYWDVQFYMRGEAERASSQGALYLTNIQQVYTERDAENDEPDAMTAVLGPKPPATTGEIEDFRKRIVARDGGPVLVINDEAHHTHDANSAWNEAIRELNDAHPAHLAAQIDFSATPRFTSGALFPWTISDYTLKQAILDRIVKRPLKGLTDIGEVSSSIASIRYEPFVTAGIERWREYRDALTPFGKKPLLFLMLNDTDEANSVGEYLQKKYPGEFGGSQTLIIHTKRNGDVAEKDLDVARKAAAEVDRDESPVNAIVSVLMLREGWDVQNVTVVVGLRPYTSKANILPEQTIGRGLRLMFRSLNTTYQERVDIIGNKGFIKFIEQLEKDEDYQLDTWQVGKDKLVITTIQPEAERIDHDIALPILSPILARSTTLEAEIDAIDLDAIPLDSPLPRKKGSHEARTFRYEGKDFLTLETQVDRQYTIPTPQTSGEIISYFAQTIAAELKLPSQFAPLAPKVRDFLRYRAFGDEVELDTPDLLAALASPVTRYVVITTFVKLLRDKLIRTPTPVLESAGHKLSDLRPFPWSQEAPVCAKTVLNKVPCENKFEQEFARFLDKAGDVARFSKLPMLFGFSIPYVDSASNLRHYYPDFVAVDRDGKHWLVETKGREDTEVQNKDRSALVWAENATELTGQPWGYIKVLQSTFEKMQPNDFSECVHVGG
ncbi:MAG: DEAD/DEAH box helicase family protein [Aggregatilineales bacterium]